MCIKCDRYKFVADLNKGSYGVVSVVKDMEHGDKLVALKRITKFEDTVDAKQEIDLHRVLGPNRHVAQLIDHYVCSDDHTICLIMDYYANGDLYEAIRADRGPRDLGTVREFMTQLIEAVQYCHSKGVYHRDIKPENILLGQDGSVKLADWGLATTSKVCTDFGVGSDRYMAPELFDEENIPDYDAEKVDIWSIGICLLNVLFSRNPFTRAAQKDKLFLDFCSSRESLFDIFPTLTSDTFAVLRHSLTIDPDNRSLEKMKEELNNVEMWTTDEFDFYDEELEVPEDTNSNNNESDLSSALSKDESAVAIDVPTAAVPAVDVDFAIEEDVVVPDDAATDSELTFAKEPVIMTTCNRQPLRTPSILASRLADSPSVSNRGWVRTMQFTPPTSHLGGLESRLGEDRNKKARPSQLRMSAMERVKELDVEDEDGDEGNATSLDDDAASYDECGSDDIDDVFLMEAEDGFTELESPFSRLNVSKPGSVPTSEPSTDEEGSIDSMPSLTQSTSSVKSSALQTPNVARSLNIPGTSTRALSGDRNLFKFGKSWSDLDDNDDDALFDHEFYGNIMNHVRMSDKPAEGSGVFGRRILSRPIPSSLR